MYLKAVSRLNNIIVCIKQVPDISQLKIDTETNTIIRSGVNNILNPYDSYALEAALRLKDENTGLRVIVLSMGPKQAEEVLRHGLALGADRAYLVSDRAFAGSDSYATAYILSEAIKEISKREGNFQAVFCGKQAVDGDTAQVGPALAERLGLCQLTSVLSVDEAEKGFEAIQESRALKRRYYIKAPCLMSFTKPDFEPRQASLRGRLKAKKETVELLDSGVLKELNTSEIGLEGSPTSVVKSYTVNNSRSCRIIDEKPEMAARILAAELNKKLKAGVKSDEV